MAAKKKSDSGQTKQPAQAASKSSHDALVKRVSVLEAALTQGLNIDLAEFET